jgi:SAM-dependent methyltransferase/glycosyltransferase involved in cell wall biosynthesis
MHVAVVARGTQAAAARVLACTLHAVHPEWPITVVAMPGAVPDLRDGAEPFGVLAPPAVLGSDLRELAETAPLDAVERVLRPALAERLLERGADRVLVLAADAELHGGLDALVAALRGADAVLVPRLLGTLPEDGERPSAADLLAAGEIDDELVAVRATDGGRALLRFWRERAVEAAEAARGAPDAAAHLRASPLAAAPRVVAARLHRLEDPGYDVSCWNLHERPLARDGERLTAGGAPLAVMRFGGFRADRPWWLSEDATRVLVLDDPVLSELCGRRAAALREAGWVADGAGLGAGELAPGVVHDERLRRLHAEAIDAGEDFGPLDEPSGADAFLAWLAEPVGRGAAAGVNRYVYDAWREREDVQRAYPDLDGAHAEGFLGWAWVHGRPELGLQEALLPPPPAFLGAHVESAGAPATLVTGYLTGHLGLGQAARSLAAALAAAGVPVGTHAVTADGRAGRREFTPLALPDGVQPEVDVLCVNAPQVPELVRELGEETLRGRYTIGQWAWETDAIPPWWDEAFDLVDEVWVYSRYVAENIGRATDVDVPVVVVPLPVAAPDPAGASVPVALGDGFVFLFAFDFLSTLARKNPVGLVEAFRRAFADGEGPKLAIKTINAGLRPEAREHLRHAAAGRGDVLVVDGAWSAGEMAALYARADCYASLHRAEGFGLTLAESMALGKPVIGTGFSGNTDFMTPSNSYLVDWAPAAVGAEGEHYPSEGKWAEPSVEHAAALMREVYDDQDAARRRGARARADVEAALSLEAVGALARRRLERIARRRDAGATAVAGSPALAEVDRRLGFDLSGAGGARAGVRGLARRGAYRALRPYARSERVLDEAMAGALRALAVDVAAERASRQRDRAQLGRLSRSLRALEDAAAEGGGARALPYVADERYVLRDEPGLGTVLGFERERGEPVDEATLYRRFEEVFRGPRERVAELVAPYLDLLDGHGPVLDVGCGRGELIEALAARGVEARGVDADAGMAAEARERGLDVAVADAVAYLEGVEDASLGAITAVHVIEHLPVDALTAFFRLAARKLRPGGLLAAETINPHAPAALKTFWVDITHRHPLFPEVALALADAAGFRRGAIWHPRGSGDAERDRFTADAYAVVAEAG